MTQPQNVVAEVMSSGLPSSPHAHSSLAGSAIRREMSAQGIHLAVCAQSDYPAATTVKHNSVDIAINMLPAVSVKT